MLRFIILTKFANGLKVPVEGTFKCKISVIELKAKLKVEE